MASEADPNEVLTGRLPRADWLRLISAAETGKDGEGEPQVVEDILSRLMKGLSGGTG